MPRRSSVFIVALVLLAAACGGSDEQATTTAAPVATGQTATTTAAPVATGQTATTTDSSTTTASPPTTTQVPPAVAGMVTRAGLGDPWFPSLGNGGYDVDHYTLDLTFDPVTRHLDAIVTIEATALQDLSGFNLDFRGFEITSLSVDGIQTEFRRTGSELEIDPTDPIPNGESFSTAISYEGRPRATTSAVDIPVNVFGWQRSQEGIEFVAAYPDGAHSWFPCNGHFSDRATFTFRITVPEGVTAAANGNLVETIVGGDAATWVWELTYPMSAPSATVVIGDLTIVDDAESSTVAGIPIRNVIPTSMLDREWPDLQRAGEMLRFLSDAFGPYPFDTYGIAVVDSFASAMESTTLGLFGDGRVYDKILVHELAHQWFADSVTMSLDDSWLAEAIARYAEWLWLEHDEGRASLDEFLTVAWDRTKAAAPPAVPDADGIFGDELAYDRGALTLHALRLEVGDEKFFELLTAYHARHAGGTATTGDFIATAEDVTGRDLSDFFDAWLFAEVMPPLPG